MVVVYLIIPLNVLVLPKIYHRLVDLLKGLVLRTWMIATNLLIDFVFDRALTLQ